MKIIKPEYNGKSIVNLMSSILHIDKADTNYPILSDYDITKMEDTTNLLFIIIDGMGYEFLNQYGKDTIFAEFQKEKLTSVFPSTTAAALTTFASGVPPLEHALTGWYMYLKEVGTASLILPFKPRIDKYSTYDKASISGNDIFNFPRIFQKLKRKSYVISNQDYIDSAYSTYSGAGSEKIGYSNIDMFFENISDVIEKDSQKKFVYAYWAQLDSLSHEHGYDSKEVIDHLFDLNERTIKLTEELKKHNTKIIITADHGLINTDKEHTLHLHNFPELKQMLSIPLCGEARAPYCYVRPRNVEKFENYIKHNMSEYCTLFSYDEMIEMNMFGTDIVNPKFEDRIGDFILLMKDNYVLKDRVLGEKSSDFIGYHGGISELEMYVPLIVI